MSDEPFTSFGTLIMQSGIPVRVKDSGGQGNWIRVPAPLAGDEDDVLTVQPDLTVAWEPPVSSPGNVLSNVVTYSNANMRAAPVAITLVPAAGAGTVLIPLCYSLKMAYGGTNAFTNAPGFLMRWNDSAAGGASTTVGLSTTFWQSTASGWGYFVGSVQNQLLSVFENQPLTTKLNAGVTGNAANNNTVEITTYYIVVPV